MNQAPVVMSEHDSESKVGVGNGVEEAAPPFARVPALVKRYSDAQLGEWRRRSLIFYSSVLFSVLIMAGFAYIQYAGAAGSSAELIAAGGGLAAVLLVLGHELLYRNLPRSALCMSIVISVFIIGLIFTGQFSGFELYLLAPLLCWQFLLLGAFGGLLLSVAVFAVVYVGMLWPVIPGAEYSVAELVGSCVLLAVLVVMSFFGEYARQRAQHEIATRHAERLLSGATDPLSGVVSREFFDEHVVALSRLLPKHYLPLGCIACRLDRYDELADGRGREVAEEALRLVAAVMAAKVAADDVICRREGATFILLCRNSAMAAARATAEDIRRAIEKLVVVGIDEGITASFGVAVISRHQDIASEVERATASLDLAQENTGGNVVFSQS